MDEIPPTTDESASKTQNGVTHKHEPTKTEREGERNEWEREQHKLGVLRGGVPSDTSRKHRRRRYSSSRQRRLPCRSLFFPLYPKQLGDPYCIVFVSRLSQGCERVRSCEEIAFGQGHCNWRLVWLCFCQIGNRKIDAPCIQAALACETSA